MTKARAQAPWLPSWPRYLKRRVKTDTAEIWREVLRGNIAWAIRVAMVALAKGAPDVQERIMAQLTPEHFALSPYPVVAKWMMDSIRKGEPIRPDELYERMRPHVFGHYPSEKDPDYDGTVDSAESVLYTYQLPIYHIFALEVPDEQVLDCAIQQMKPHYERVKRNLRRAGIPLRED